MLKTSECNEQSQAMKEPAMSVEHQGASSREFPKTPRQRFTALFSTDRLWYMSIYILLPIKIILTALALFAVYREWSHADCVYGSFPYPRLLHYWTLLSTFLFESVLAVAGLVYVLCYLVVLIYRGFRTCFGSKRVDTAKDFGNSRYSFTPLEVPLEEGKRDTFGDTFRLRLWDIKAWPVWISMVLVVLGAFGGYYWMTMIVQLYYVDPRVTGVCDIQRTTPLLFGMGAFWLGVAYFYIFGGFISIALIFGPDTAAFCCLCCVAFGS
ncbi:hypothetical protein BJ742DRAFT_478353 [Cladochytrium replicatum]|nr:hypothetical protein BJ742DRAFT_478353 [Cladochytrium replicatum]